MAIRIYLDHGSTTAPSSSVLEAFRGAAETFGDPLQHHGPGRAALAALEEARGAVAAALKAQPDEVVFTSGGTESIALAVRGVLSALGGGSVVAGAVEHPAVAAAVQAEGMEAVRIPVDGSGRADLDAFVPAVRADGVALASIQHSNHEVGTLQPMAEAARLAREAGVLFHTDACQSVGRLPIDVEALDVDLLTLSGHKFGAPPGIGALYVRRGTPFKGYPAGDARERRRRAGIENVPGAVAMAAALTEALDGLGDRAGEQWAMTDTLRARMAEIGGEIYGHPTQRLPHLACASFPGLDTEVLLMALDEKGFAVAAGPYATGLPHDESPVLAAMGVRGIAPIRVGVGPSTKPSEVESFLDTLGALVPELRRVEDESARTLDRLRRRGGGA
jgi:cysteine desulfurase